MGVVDDTISALKLRLNAESDSDLARRLGLDKRTISAWRSRGSVPQRYCDIAQGEHPAPIWTPPAKWGTYEELAFRLALFRFARVRADAVQHATVGTMVSLFGGAGGFWLLMHQAQSDIARVSAERGIGEDFAFALVIDEDITSGARAIDRDAAILAST